MASTSATGSAPKKKMPMDPFTDPENLARTPSQVKLYNLANASPPVNTPVAAQRSQTQVYRGAPRSPPHRQTSFPLHQRSSIQRPRRILPANAHSLPDHNNPCRSTTLGPLETSRLLAHRANQGYVEIVPPATHRPAIASSSQPQTMDLPMPNR